MPTLLELPSELLELNVCQYLDVSSLLQLALANRQLEHDMTHCSKLWSSLVSRHFGYVDKAPPARRPETESIRWKNVFAAAWRDAMTISTPSLQESDVLQIYRKQDEEAKLLEPLEAQIRQELMLMQALRRFPASIDIIHLYADTIRKAHLVPRADAASAAKTLRRLALEPST